MLELDVIAVLPADRLPLRQVKFDPQSRAEVKYAAAPLVLEILCARARPAPPRLGHRLEARRPDYRLPSLLDVRDRNP